MEMLKIVLEEIRAVRERLDGHVDDEAADVKAVRKDIAKIKEEIRDHRTKLAFMTAGIAMFVSAFIGWMIRKFGG